MYSTQRENEKIEGNSITIMIFRGIVISVKSYSTMFLELFHRMERVEKWDNLTSNINNETDLNIYIHQRNKKKDRFLRKRIGQNFILYMIYIYFEKLQMHQREFKGDYFYR